MRLAGLLGTLALLLGLLAPTAPVVAQDQGLAEVPTTGGRRPGPIGRDAVAVARRASVSPVAIQIDTAAVDAEIERVNIVDGVMQNPSGPWVVSWYEDLAGLGEGGNVVMAGHVDYWNVGPAVFWALQNPGMAKGDTIRVVGENEQVYEYQVEWSKLYTLDELTPDTINADIVGPTDSESLTLITCGGEFDVARGEYLSRMVVRATLVP